MRHLTSSRVLLACLVGFLLCGCAPSLGRKLVITPNHGQAAAQLRAHDAPPQMDGAVIDHRFRVRIAEPAASLSVWVIDPSNEKLFDNEQGLWFAILGDKPRATRKPTGTVLILHGFRHPKNNWAYLMWARFFASHGYRAVLIDLRGHGGSSGDHHTFGVVESRDLVRVVDELYRRKLLAGKLGSFGGSYGGAASIQFAGVDPRVKAVVSISAYSSMREVARPFIQTELGWLSGLVGIWGYDNIVDQAGKAGAFDPEATDGRAALRKSRARSLIIHSLNDRHVPLDHARALAEAAGKRGKLMLIDGPDHFNFGVRDSRQVRDVALEWFQRHLQ